MKTGLKGLSQDIHRKRGARLEPGALGGPAPFLSASSNRLDSSSRLESPKQGESVSWNFLTSVRFSFKCFIFLP